MCCRSCPRSSSIAIKKHATGLSVIAHTTAGTIMTIMQMVRHTHVFQRSRSHSAHGQQSAQGMRQHPPRRMGSSSATAHLCKAPPVCSATLRAVRRTHMADGTRWRRVFGPIGQGQRRADVSCAIVSTAQQGFGLDRVAELSEVAPQLAAQLPVRQRT